MVQYREDAATKYEAEEKARKLLLQLLPAGESSFKLVSTDAKDTEGDFLFYSLALKRKPDEDESNLPTVYVYRIKEETSSESGKYWLYLLPDKEQLPFYSKQLRSMQILLPFSAPLLKPDESLEVGAVHAPSGREKLETYFNFGETYPTSKEREAVELLRTAPKEMKIYAFFDNFGEGTLQDVKDALDAGEYEGGTLDGELILALLTGKTYETEKKYLSALSELCGAEAVQKYKDELVHGYAFYSLSFYVRYLEYRLRQSEDFSALQQEEPELRREYGFKEKYLDEMQGDATALELALARYLSGYTEARSLYAGVTLARIADYIGAPLETVRKAISSTDWHVAAL